jgi:hypothetical protein
MIDLPSLPPYWPVAVALVGFGALGLRRGWVRELATLGLVLLTWVIVLAFGLSVVGALNRIALIASFIWQGGFDAADPGPLLRTLRAAPAIDQWHPEGLYLSIFCLGALAAYLIGNRLASRVRSPAEAVLGGLAGALNGYLLAYVALGYLHGALRAPASEPLAILGGYATTVAVVVVVAAVAFALVSSARGPALKPKRSGRASA